MENLRNPAEEQNEGTANSTIDWGTSYTWPSPTITTYSMPSATLIVRAHFDAAHRLRDYIGECANLHGHTWKVEVHIPVIQPIGLGKKYYDGVTTDFKHIKQVLKEILPDHKYLNDVFEFNPTAENIAIWLKTTLCERGIWVSKVIVWESEDCGVEY